MAKCKRCGNKIQTRHPDLTGVLCDTCRANPLPATEQKQIGYGQSDKPAGYSQVYRNLTREQIQALRDKQQGKCAICHKIRFLVLDHDHKTNKARGYLCRGCNTKLAGLDDIDFMGRAREYLDNPPANNLSG